MTQLQVCPGTLARGFDTYSPKALRYLFDGARVSHILPFESPGKEGSSQRIFFENRSKISISGVQIKFSLKRAKNMLELTEKGGEYILKPIPDNLKNVSQVPANEHLTMQIADQIFNIKTAKSALIFFEDGIPAYITKRFDVKSDGSRCLKEDFASLAQLSEENGGSNYKYNFSYLRMAGIIDQYFQAAIPAKEQFFRLIIFNYLFSNGDAHLKNFARLDCEGNGYGMLAPAYDLINTRLHIDDGDFALTNHLYDGDYEHPSYATLGYHAFDDFYTFGLKMQLMPIRVKKMLNGFLVNTDKVEEMVANSFLNDKMKWQYIYWYHDKLRRLNVSVSGLLKHDDR
jgi:serine/threonine-protein kinase HipA